MTQSETCVLTVMPFRARGGPLERGFSALQRFKDLFPNDRVDWGQIRARERSMTSRSILGVRPRICSEMKGC